MLVSLRRRRAQALLLLMLTVAIAAALLSAPGRAADAANPPPNPSDQQIQSAQQQKAAIADQVGRLGAQVAQIQSQINQLQAAQELAEQKLANALDKLAQAKDASAAAAHAVKAANARVVAAQRQYRSFIAATYMSGDVGGTTGSLLTASDPNIVLQQSAMENYESEHQLDAIGNLKTATVAKSNADAAARRAVQNQKNATAAAAVAKQNADAAVATAKQQQQQLQASLASSQRELSAAQLHLATLNNQRAKYIAYQKHQAYLRHLAYLRHQAELARQRRIAEQQRKQAEQQQQHNGGGGGGGGFSNGPAPRPSGGHWSAGKAATAVSRAEHYLGWMYAWAGGNASGPTYGVCAGDGAYNDCHVLGFDCSGLTLYGWAPYIRMDHYAATQYTQAGRFHPSLGNLRPGDLLFWSSNGTIGGIHHVAMYVGGGNVIQAPESGVPIQITPVSQVSWGYFGATRPLT